MFPLEFFIYFSRVEESKEEKFFYLCSISLSSFLLKAKCMHAVGAHHHHRGEKKIA